MTSGRVALVLAAAALAAACGESGVLPRLQIPQLEQTRQSVEGGIGKRYQDHAACAKTATDAQAMVACMEIAGYGYIPRSAEERAMECWRLRDANSTDPVPEAACFVHRDEAPAR